MNESEERNTAGSILIGVLLLLPVAWLLVFASLIVRARIHTGMWPVARQGSVLDPTFVDTTIDPKVFGIHTSIVWAGFFLLQVTVPVALILLVMSIWMRDFRSSSVLVLCFGVSVLMVVMTVLLDVGGYWLWLLD